MQTDSFVHALLPGEIPQLHAVGITTRKRRGEIAEAAFLAKASSLGFGVAKPWETASATTSSSTPDTTTGASRSNPPNASPSPAIA